MQDIGIKAFGDINLLWAVFLESCYGFSNKC